MPNGICSIDGCGKRMKARGWCSAHYMRWSKHGDPLIVLARPAPLRRKPASLEVRLFDRVDRSRDGCWTWTGPVLDGYPVRIKVAGRTQWRHRASYQLVNGAIPEGVLVDHRCRNKLCLNPAHLRLATQKQNGENRAGAQANSKSGVLGVSWHKTARKWRVSIKHRGADVYGGLFADLDEAEHQAIRLRNRFFTHNDGDRAVA